MLAVRRTRLHRPQDLGEAPRPDDHGPRPRTLPHPLRVAVMGCVVNGPGEAREADLGVAAGNGKGQIFVHGKIIATVPESHIVGRLIEEALKLTETPNGLSSEVAQ